MTLNEGRPRRLRDRAAATAAVTWRARVRALVLCLVSLSLLAAALPAPASQATNVIVNGDFEKPVVPPGSFQTYSTGSSFEGWTVTGASGDVSPISGSYASGNLTFPAHGGAQWLDLTGYLSNTPTGVAQTVTTAGGSCTLNFFVGNISGGVFGTTSTVDVLVNGTKVTSATNSTGGSTLNWQRFTETISTTAGATTIEFHNADPSTDNSNGLDDVELLCDAAPTRPRPAFGVDLVYSAPPIGKAAKLLSPTLSTAMRRVEFHAQLVGAAPSILSGVIKAPRKSMTLKERKLFFWNCVYFSAQVLEYGPGLAIVSCLDLLERELQRARSAASSPRAEAARRCGATVVPLNRRGKRPSARTRKRVVRRTRKLVRVQCSSDATGRLSLRLSARGKRATLRKLLGRRVRVDLGRSRPRSGSDGPNPQLVVRWTRR
jgi:hypothetical protein